MKLRKTGFAMAAAVVAMVLCGCNSAKERPPHSLPRDFVAVFDEPATGKKTVLGEEKLAATRFPPCSTFKIISSLMGLEAGVLKNADTQLGYDGTRYEIAAWNGDLTLREAFRASCVPYYKKLTGKLEKSYVQDVLNRLNYGNADLSVWNRNGHNVFWIESSLLISPLEQIRVIERIVSGQSGFAAGHVAILLACMRSDQAGAFQLYGKTGTGRNHRTNRLEGWFVGFAEAPDGNKIFFAAHGGDPARDVTSAEIRETVRKELSK